MIIETKTQLFRYDESTEILYIISKKDAPKYLKEKGSAGYTKVFEEFNDLTDYEKAWLMNPFVGTPGVVIEELDGSPSELVRTVKVPNGSLSIVDGVATLTFSIENHASNHVDGTDDIQDATAAQKGLATAAQITKLSGIETSATADQTGTEIKTAYELEADTNAYNDAAVSKLGGIEALADVTSTNETSHADVLIDGDFTAADEIMVGTGVGTHGQVTLAASQFLAKKSSGTATNVSASEARTILNVADGADVTSTNETSHAAVLVDNDFNAKGDILSASADNTPLILTVGANDLVLTADSGEATGLKWATAAAAAAVGRNAIINGDFNIWQRGTTNTGIANIPTYVADRWAAWAAGTLQDITFSRQAAALAGFVYCGQVQRTASETNTAAMGISQNLENFNVYPFQGKIVTLSFYAKKGANFSAASDLINIKMSSGTTGNESTATYSNGPATGLTGHVALIDTTQAITSSWVKYSFTTAAVASDAAQIALWISYTPVGTAGADDHFSITGVQLELGSVATDFEYRQFGDELQKCQRYYSKSYLYATAPASATGTGAIQFQTSAVANADHQVLLVATFPVSMRAAATVVSYDIAGASGKATMVAGNNIAATVDQQTDISFRNRATNGAASTSRDLSFQWTASAEL